MRKLAFFPPVVEWSTMQFHACINVHFPKGQQLMRVGWMKWLHYWLLWDIMDLKDKRKCCKSRKQFHFINPLSASRRNHPCPEKVELCTLLHIYHASFKKKIWCLGFNPWHTMLITLDVSHWKWNGNDIWPEDPAVILFECKLTIMASWSVL